jgi:hypothetical protein
LTFFWTLFVVLIYLKTTFRIKDSATRTGKGVLNWVQSIELVPNSGPKTGKWIMSKKLIIVLLYHRHRRLDLMSKWDSEPLSYVLLRLELGGN